MSDEIISKLTTACQLNLLFMHLTVSLLQPEANKYNPGKWGKKHLLCLVPFAATDELHHFFFFLVIFSPSLSSFCVNLSTVFPPGHCCDIAFTGGLLE